MNKVRILVGSALALILCGCGVIQQCAVGKTVTQTVNIDKGWQGIAVLLVIVVLVLGMTWIGARFGGGGSLE